MKPKILVVDGDEALLEAISAALVDAGYEVACARDGFEALRDLKKVHPDALIADVVLSKLDGLDLTRALRSQPETAGVPVIFISQKTQRDTVEEARRLGAKKFIAKPFDMANLLQCLAAVLKT